MASQEPWIHSGWMSKQGHKMSTWKNRYFVLTATTLYYYKEEIAESTGAPDSAVLAGQFSLQRAKVYPTMWAPEGAFGWMVATAEGVKYPLRCFGFKDREIWLRKVTSISSVSSAEEKLNESTRGILGGFPSFSGRRTSGGNFSGSVLGSFSVSGGGNEAMGNAQAAAHEAELEEFLATTCGMKHMFGRFRACGVESVTQLCAELNSPAIPDALLHAPPLGMSPGEVEKLRSVCEIHAKKPDSEMKDFLNRLEMSKYEAALEAYGVARLGDLIDPRIVSDEDLVGADLGFSSDDAQRFRTAAQHAEKQRAQAASPAGGGGGGQGQLVQRLTGFNGGDDDNDDGGSAFQGFSSMKNDVVVAAHAQLGMPYIGKHGKLHPIYDLVLVGEKESQRVRSYRFRTLRVFQEEQVANEAGFHTQGLGAAFPTTLTKSMFGMALSESELQARVGQLSKWVAELLRVRAAMSPRLRRATLNLFQVDEGQLFPETLVLGRLGGGAVETLELALVKGFSGLGLDLVPRADGAVLVTIVRPYVSGPPAGAGAEEVASPPHPADQAKPSPLLDGDEIVAVNGKRFEGDFSACKSLIRTAPEHVKLTICRPRKNDADAAPDAKSSSSGIDDNAPLVVGKSLEEWNVALGATSVFVSAYLVEVSGGNGTTSPYGLLLIVTRPADQHKCALVLPPSALRQVRATVPSLASLVASRAHALVLAKRLTSGLEAHANGYHLKLNGFGLLTSSSVMEPSDMPSICLRKALVGHATRIAPNSQANANAYREQLRYVLDIKGVGAVSGVPPRAIRMRGSTQPLTSPAKAGDQVEMDYNGKWTPATVTSASNSAATPPPPAGARAAAPPPVAAAVAAAYHQGNGVAEDSDDEGGTDLSSSSHPGSSSADSGGGASSSSSGDLESMNEAELSAYVNDQVGGLLSFEEFKDALIRGIQVVKFNRRGAAAFRTLTLLGDHTLTWTTPKEGEKLKAKGDFDLRDLKDVRRGEDPDPTSNKAGDTGTDVLRKYAAKNKDGAEMMATGHCLSLIFKDRSVDVGTDSTAHRDFLLNGFRLLGSRGPSGGSLVTVELKVKTVEVGFEVKAEVKSSGVVQQAVGIASVSAGSEAAAAGLKPGDRLYSINGQEQQRWLSPKVPASKVAKLVQLKLKRLSKAKAPYTIVVERLNAAEHAADLRVAKERAFVAWLDASGLGKFSLKLIQAGIKDIESLKYNLEAHKASLTNSKVGMRRADFKKLLAALDSWNDDVAGGHTGYTLGDRVTWKGEDEDLPRGTLGTVHVIHDDGDVEALFVVRGEEQIFTFAAHRLNLVSSVSSSSSSSSSGGDGSSASTTNTGRLLSTRRGSMEPGTLDGNTRTGVSFGLKGPCGGRLVSINLESPKALGLVLGEVGSDGAAAATAATASPSKKKEKPRVLVVDVVAGSEAAKMGVLVGDRIHMINDSVVPVSASMKTVKSRVSAAKRPLHLIFEREQQEPGYERPSMAVLVEAAAMSAKEEQDDALYALRDAIFAKSTGTGEDATSCPWHARDDASTVPAVPFAQWKGLKFEKQAGGLAALVEMDLAYFNLSIDLQDLRPLLAACPHLKELRLNGNEQVTGNIALLVGEDEGRGGSGTPDVNFLPELKTLSLVNCVQLTGELAVLQKLASLKALNMDNCSLVRGDPKTLKAACPQMVVCSAHGIAGANSRV